MVEFIVDVLTGLIGSRGRSSRKRTYDAYKSAWRSANDPNHASDETLRAALKEQSAPGAYTDPDGAALSPWLDAWRQGLTPRQARRAVCQADNSQHT